MAFFPCIRTRECPKKSKFFRAFSSANAVARDFFLSQRTLAWAKNDLHFLCCSAHTWVGVLLFGALRARHGPFFRLMSSGDNPG